MPTSFQDISDNISDVKDKLETYKQQVNELFTILKTLNNNKRNDEPTKTIRIEDKHYVLTQDNILMKYGAESQPPSVADNLYGDTQQIKDCENSIAEIEEPLEDSINSIIYLGTNVDIGGEDGRKGCDKGNDLSKVYYTDLEPEINNKNLSFYNQYINLKTNDGNSKKYFVDGNGVFYAENEDPNPNCFIYPRVDPSLENDKKKDQEQPTPLDIDYHNDVETSNINQSDDCFYNKVFKTRIDDISMVEQEFYKAFNNLLTNYNDFNISENTIPTNINNIREDIRDIIENYNDLKLQIDNNNNLKNITKAQKNDIKSLSDHMQFKMATTSIVGIIIILLLFNTIKK